MKSRVAMAPATMRVAVDVHDERRDLGARVEPDVDRGGPSVPLIGGAGGEPAVGRRGSHTRGGSNLRMRKRWSADDLAALGGVGGHPGDEMARSHPGRLLLRDRLEDGRGRHVVAGPQVADDVELGVGGQGSPVKPARVEQEQRRLGFRRTRPATRRARRCR